jgi:hypothetical protein
MEGGGGDVGVPALPHYRQLLAAAHQFKNLYGGTDLPGVPEMNLKRSVRSRPD